MKHKHRKDFAPDTMPGVSFHQHVPHDFTDRTVADDASATNGVIWPVISRDQRLNYTGDGIHTTSSLRCHREGLFVAAYTRRTTGWSRKGPQQALNKIREF